MEDTEVENEFEGTPEDWIRDGWMQDENGEWYKNEEVEEEWEDEEVIEEYDGSEDPGQRQQLEQQGQFQPLATQQNIQQWVGQTPPIINQLPPLNLQPQALPAAVVQRSAVSEALAPAQTVQEAAKMGRQLDRAYKFEDYEPRMDGWLADVATEVFVSLFFKVYFGFFLFTTGGLLGLFFVNWLFTTVYNVFRPPGDSIPYIQSFGLVAAFFFLSMAMVAGICMWLDVVKIFVAHSRNDGNIWGLSHPRFPTLARFCCCSQCGSDKAVRNDRQQKARSSKKETSPWIVHLLLVFLVLVFPIVYALIATVAGNRSVTYFAQQLFYVTTIVTAVVLALLYLWFHFRAYSMKIDAYRRRKEDDSQREVRLGKDGREPKVPKDNWYRSQLFLEELGLDSRTLRWSIIAIPVGLTPVFAINVAMALDGVDSSNNAGWVATVLVMCCALLLIQQVAESKRGHRAVFVALTFISIYVILGVIGCAVTGHPASIATVVVPFILTQGTLIRKRDHSLTRSEIRLLLDVPLEKSEDSAMQATRWDTFLCSGRNTFYACLECLDIHTIFGYRHPKVVEEEKRLRRERACLRSDYKVLMGFWGIVGICYFFVILIGQVAVERNDTVISAVGTGSSVAGVDPFAFCEVPIVPVASHTRSLTIVDMAMFAALTNSFGTDQNVDYATWFSDIPSIRRVYPTGNFISESGLAWEHLVDSTTETHIINVRTSNRGYFWAQSIFTWGESLAFQIASVIAPQLITWDLSDKRSMVQGMGILKKAFSSDWLPTEELEAYAAGVQSGLGMNASFVLVGTGFGGGYAKIVGSRLGIAHVTFNAPGVELSWANFGLSWNNPKSIEVVSYGSLLSSIDLPTKDGSLYTIPCLEDSANACSGSIQTLKMLLQRCGDSQGRRVAS